MTAKLLTAMSSLTETENKNNNIQTNKQTKKKTKQKANQNHKKKLKNTHTHTKKYSKSFTTMISRPDTTVQCSSTENHMLDACIQNFFPSFNFV